jgi:MOSC domain-containing protein YiiM
MAPYPIQRDVILLSEEEDEVVKSQKVLGPCVLVEHCGKSTLARCQLSASFIVLHQGLAGGSFAQPHVDETQAWTPTSDRMIVLQPIEEFSQVGQSDDDVVLDPRFEKHVTVHVKDINVCLGDVLQVVGSTLNFRVSSPRIATRGAVVGWFCEVLDEGSLLDGSEITLVERPLPHWSLRELDTAIFGDDIDPSLRRKPSWGRTLSELEELLALPFLSHSSWRTILGKLQRQEREKRLPIPYLDSVDSKSDRTVASVLGLYGRGPESNEQMPRAQVLDARFVPEQGMVGHAFWQVYDTEGFITNKSERAVLLQSIQAYRRVQREKFRGFPNTDVDVLVDPCFGEQVILDIPGDICLGDVYCVPGSTLTMRVTSPRKPCTELDRKNNTTFGTTGIRHLTNSTALAGWFCEVLTEGSLTKGSCLELVERPYPQWTIEELARALYGGEGDPRTLLRGTASWGRPIEQLRELIRVPYLANCEWKEAMLCILEKLEAKSVKTTSATMMNCNLHHAHIGSQHGNSWLPLLFTVLVATCSCIIVRASGDAS